MKNQNILKNRAFSQIVSELKKIVKNIRYGGNKRKIMKKISIGNTEISLKSSIFLIAEAGVNHNGDINLAKKLIDIAANARVDAVKFQTYNSDSLILKSTSKVDYQKNKTDSNESFYDMLKRYELSNENFKELKIYCEKKGITFLSTAFDDLSVELLDLLQVPAYKIGSGDMNNFPLLKLICSKQKPILLSTGMATLEEVKDSVSFIIDNQIEEIVIFQCTTNYPAHYEEINLNVIGTFKKEFPEFLIGFSDHSLGIEASLGAAAKGVKVIEKHFTLDKNMEGPDHRASLDPDELMEWVIRIRNLEKALGSFKKFPSKNEKNIAKKARKSIVSTKNLEKGEVLTTKNISVKRPGLGISPKFFEECIGKKVKENIPIDSIIKWEDIE